MIEVHTRDVPEQHVSTEQRSVDQAQLQEWLPGAMARVAQAGGLLGTTAWPHLERPGPDEPVFVVIYEGNPNEGPTDVEVCVVVAAADSATRTILAHREAYVRVTKQQVITGQLGGIYETVEKWISDQGLQVSAAPRETYWTDFMAAADSDAVFDVGFPFAGRA